MSTEQKLILLLIYMSHVSCTGTKVDAFASQLQSRTLNNKSTGTSDLNNALRTRVHTILRGDSLDAAQLHKRTKRIGVLYTYI